ncbi:erlin (er lipid raft associated protein) [Anaeramoeba ignava]|uniref:Erlin (Er lipid raft associated protein) n=1 Tax=Anaeramoeba ignava TaxID=1746090 RepID=A0A9Q0RDQ3_ANAIG|nr:erlin (er lipid raft associated protein) [Anaeramoeba ignava]
MASLFFVFLPLVIGIIAVLLNGIHHIPEGYIGLYWRGGALLPSYEEPGYHLKFPFLTTVEICTNINIPCGTSGGVMLYFEKIEVVNRLKKLYAWDTIKNYTTQYDKIWIYEKIAHEINQFCSLHTLEEVYITLFDTIDERLSEALQESINVWAPGIELISIRVTKPIVPKAIMRNYEEIEKKKTELKIADQEQQISERKAETERMKANIEAQKEKEVSIIKMQQEIEEKKSLQQMSEIEDQIHSAKIKKEADSFYYQTMKEAEAYSQLLTPEYLKMKMIESISQTSKVYYGPNIEDVFNLKFDQIESLTEMLQNPEKEDQKIK